MTVIEFGKRDVRVNALFIALGTLVVCSVLVSIIAYNKVISLRHDTEMLRDTIGKEQVRNAELKNDLYEKIEGSSAESYLSERGYIFDKSPKYNKTQSQQVADINY